MGECMCRAINGEPCFGCVPLGILKFPRVRHCLKREHGCMVNDRNAVYCDWQRVTCPECEISEGIKYQGHPDETMPRQVTYLENPERKGCPVCRIKS